MTDDSLKNELNEIRKSFHRDSNLNNILPQFLSNNEKLEAAISLQPDILFEFMMEAINKEKPTKLFSIINTDKFIEQVKSNQIFIDQEVTTPPKEDLKCSAATYLINALENAEKKRHSSTLLKHLVDNKDIRESLIQNYPERLYEFSLTHPQTKVTLFQPDILKCVEEQLNSDKQTDAKIKYPLIKAIQRIKGAPAKEIVGQEEKSVPKIPAQVVGEVGIDPSLTHSFLFGK